MAKSILILENEPHRRKAVTDLLVPAYTVLEADTDAAALEILQRQAAHISAVVLHSFVPDVTGDAVLQAMQASARCAQIPALVCTDDDTVQELALAHGACAVLPAACRDTLLQATLRSCIRLCEAAARDSRLDQLTGLCNRESFLKQAEALIASQPLGHYILSSFDIENFKVINDQYGTRRGDAVLQHVADCIRDASAFMNGICCRFMADRFAMLYPASYLGTPFMAETQVRASAPACIDHTIKIRVGRYRVNDDTISINSMYDRATLAQEAIRGRYDICVREYDESMRKSLLNEQQIVTVMYDALRSGQFVPWFQPQYNHATGAIVGAEALVRWKKPDGTGFISPGEFIPIFERNGFIYELDKYIWDQACRVLRSWIDTGRQPTPISVNISRHDIFHPDFYETITGLLAEYALPIDLLRLEITESAFSNAPEQIVTAVKRLVSFGFTVEIDDFGSGYSSLNTLKDVPAHVLKLDMRFMSDDGDSQRGGSIVESIVRMAKWIGMTVIAEGVEEKAQADYLKSIGCYLIQGYYYARPMPLADYEALLDKSSIETECRDPETVESFDNSAFWNPKSMDTLIFNSYVGGASILEFHNGKAETLRISDRFRQVFGERFLNGTPAAMLGPEQTLDSENLAILYTNVRKAIDTRRESTCEVQTIALEGGNEKPIFLRCTVRVIARTEDRYLCYSVITNVTSLRNAQQNERIYSERLRAIMDHADCGITAVVLHDDAPAEYLFVNNRYYELLGYTREEYATLQGDFTLMHPEDLARYDEEIRALRTIGQSGVFNFRARRCDGQEIRLRCAISVISFDQANGPVQLSSFTDITAEAEATGKLQAVMDGMDSAITASVIHDGSVEFLMSNNRYYEILGYTRDEYAAAVTNIFDLIHPDDLEMVRENTLLAYATGEPLRMEYRVLGRNSQLHWVRVQLTMTRFAGVPQPVQLCIFTEITAEKEAEEQLRRLHERISSEDQALTSIMNGIPGGFGRMQVLPDDTIRPLYYSDSFLQMVGIDRAVLTAAMQGEPDDTDFPVQVHPDDAAALHNAYARMISAGEAGNVRFRLRKSNGSYIRMTVTGKLRVSDTGERFLNLYYAEAASTPEEVLYQKELLDNLPCGAALYELDGEHVAVIHLNKHYQELIGSAGAEESLSPLDVIYPPDLEVVSREVTAAIAEHRDAVYDIRMLHGEAGYRPFHVVAHLVPRGNDIYAAYTAYTPISDEEMSLQDMLPVALATIMSSSAEFTFIKNKRLQYICGSNSMVQLLGLHSQQELIGKTDHELFDAALAAQFEASDREIMQTHASVLEQEEVIPDANGGFRYTKISKYPLCDSNGSVIGIYGISRDVTEERTDGVNLRLLTESISGGLASFTFADDKLRLDYCNEGFYAFSGYTHAEYLALTADDPLALIFEADRPAVDAAVQALVRGETPDECVYRCRTKDGGRRWFGLNGSLTEYTEDHISFHVVQYDLTAQKKIEEQLRRSEEQYRLALMHSGNVICNYDIRHRELHIQPDVAARFSLPTEIRNLPDGLLEDGIISPETADTFLHFYEQIHNGERESETVIHALQAGDWHWLEMHASTIFSESGKPVTAVISVRDVTDECEKEAIYKKWQQSLQEKSEDSYTMYCCNLSRNATPETMSGSLLRIQFDNNDETTFNACTEQYAAQFVLAEDRDHYIRTLNADTLLAGYYRGKRTESLEYREIVSEKTVRWLRRTVELVEYPNSTDIMVYLMFEDIDARKRAELQTRALALTDPLTGLLNRRAFVEQTIALLRKSSHTTHFALMLLDLDGFKGVNDTFGHGVGDNTLIDVGHKLRYVFLSDDLICRLGGDEFIVCLCEVPNRSIIETRAGQICTSVRRRFGQGVQLSASVGIAVSPDDGRDFDTLYRKADQALYTVKKNGKNGYAFYCDDMDEPDA